MAEGVGFEPTIRFPVYTLSKRAPSATRPSLRATLWRAQYSRRGPGSNPRPPALPTRKRRCESAWSGRRDGGSIHPEHLARGADIVAGKLGSVFAEGGRAHEFDERL